MLTLALCACVLLQSAAALAGDASTRGPLVYDFGVAGAPVSYNDDRPVFEIHTSFERNDSRNQVLAPRHFAAVERNEEGDTVTLTWSKPPQPWPASLRITVEFRRLERETEARLTMHSDGGMTIRKIKFPVVDVQPTYPFDTLLLSHPMGDNVYYPNREIGGRLGGEAIYRYPATLCMQYMVLYNGARSYYLSAYSTGDETFEHSAKNHERGQRLACVWFPFLEKGTWQSPPCGFSVLPGGWHSSADLYRDRMGKIYRPPELPAWMRESFHGWMRMSFKGNEPDKATPFTKIPDMYSRAESLGLNVLHIFGWGKGGFDNDYPLRFPSPINGTPAELRQAMDTVRARGGRVILYTNGRLIDPDAEFFTEMNGHNCLAFTEDNKPYFEQYAGRTFYVACPAAQGYQDALFDNFRRMILDYGAHAAQIDQTCCTPGVFCYSSLHGHSKPNNNWLTSTDRLLERLHRFYREQDPDFFVWNEGPNERFGQFYEVSEGHGEEGTWTLGDSLPEQFSYTYPDFLMTGIADSIDTMCHTFGQGKAFDFDHRQLGKPDWVTLIKRLIAVRKAEPDYFLRGLFMDDVGLAVGQGQVRAWRIDHRRRPGTLVNLWAKGTELTAPAATHLRMPRSDWPVRAVYPEDLQIEKDGSWLELRWTGPLATLISQP